MRINDQRVTSFLAFWRRIESPTDQEFSDQWKQGVRTAIQGLSGEELSEALRVWQGEYDASDDIPASVRSRSSGLLGPVGILAGLAALVAGDLRSIPWPYAVLPVLLIVFVVWTGFASGFLALRAQQVGVWRRARLDTSEAGDLRAMRVARATDLYSAARRNALISAVMVGYLRDAQTYALAMIGGLSALVLSIALAGVASSPADLSPGSPSPSPATSPTSARTGSAS